MLGVQAVVFKEGRRVKWLVGLCLEQSFSQTGQESASKGAGGRVRILGEGVKRKVWMRGGRVAEFGWRSTMDW